MERAILIYPAFMYDDSGDPHFDAPVERLNQALRNGWRVKSVHAMHGGGSGNVSTSMAGTTAAPGGGIERFAEFDRSEQESTMYGCFLVICECEEE